MGSVHAVLVGSMYFCWVEGFVVFFGSKGSLYSLGPKCSVLETHSGVDFKAQ